MAPPAACKAIHLNSTKPSVRSKKPIRWPHTKSASAAKSTPKYGVIYFLQKEFSRALPYLKRSSMFGHWMGGAMLGVIYYKKKDHAAMRQTFETVTRRGKKHGLAWCLYAYLLTQMGDQETAQQVLTRGVKAAADDSRVKDALLAVQNGKKIKMKAYKEQWYQFHLERPPPEYAQPAMGGKVSRAARRGRW